MLIALLKSENEDYGYNQTSVYDDAMKRYIARIEIKGATLEHTSNEDSFFESSNLPRSACEELIEQWIFNDDHRRILKSRLLDGMSYPDLSKKYNKSVRQLKNIVYSGCEKLSKRF